MLSSIASFYVNVIEPTLQVLAVAALVIIVLYLLNLLRGGDRKGDLITVVVNESFKFIFRFIVLIGKSLILLARMLLNTSRVIFATLRDFFKSEI